MQSKATNQIRSRGFSIGLVVCAVAVQAAWASPAWSDPAPNPYPRMAPLSEYLPTDRASEIALARTAAPASISGKATVMVLTKDGYDTAVKGSNGFTCFVQRSWAQDFDAPEFWNPKARTPQCWNAAAVSWLLPDYLNRTKWVLAGVSKEEMAARTRAEFANNAIVPPAQVAMVYMYSKQQYILDPTPGVPANWYPHVMFFVPTTDASTWGANNPGSALASTTSDIEPVTTFYVLVPKWSDGTLSPYVTAAKPSEHHHHG